MRSRLNDFNWQLQTSLGRLLVQVWPLVLIGGFVTMREPQLADHAAPPPKNTAKRRGKDASQIRALGQHRSGQAIA